MIIALTDDYGRKLDAAPQAAPVDGWLVEAFWCNRPASTPQCWFVSSQEEAIAVLAEQQDGNVIYAERGGPPTKDRDGLIRADLTALNCQQSDGEASPVKAGDSFVFADED